MFNKQILLLVGIGCIVLVGIAAIILAGVFLDPDIYWFALPCVFIGFGSGVVGMLIASRDSDEDPASTDWLRQKTQDVIGIDNRPPHVHAQE